MCYIFKQYIENPNSLTRINCHSCIVSLHNFIETEKIENWEEYFPKFNKILIDFCSDIVTYEVYSKYIIFIESPKIKILNLHFTNFVLKKIKKYENDIEIYFPRYLIKKIPNDVLSNLPTDLRTVKFMFDHTNMYRYCFEHRTVFNKHTIERDCIITDNTIFIDPETFINLPISVSEIIITACMFGSVNDDYLYITSIIFDKCKLPHGINIILNFKISRKATYPLKLERVTLPEGINSFTIRVTNSENLSVSEHASAYLKLITKFSIEIVDKF
jgi:hypothetical protein